MSVDYKLIGQRIKDKRKQNGLTQEQLSEQLSVTVGYVSQLERGITKINLDMLSSICTVLDCDMAQLVTGTAVERESYLQDTLAAKYHRLNDAQKRLTVDFIDLLLRQET